MSDTTETSAEQAARLGVQTAHQLIIVQADAGMPVDRIEAHHHDVIAGLFRDAETEDGRAFANGYGYTVDTYVAELRELEQPSPVRHIEIEAG